MAAGADPTKMDSKGRSAIYWSLRNRDYDLFAFMIDSYNPRCWVAMLQKRVEELLVELPESHLLALQQQWYNPPTLAKQCRLVIRLHLLRRFNYRSLFLLVPRLPVPALIQRFILVNTIRMPFNTLLPGHHMLTFFSIVSQLDQEQPDEETTPCFMKEMNIKS